MHGGFCGAARAILWLGGAHSPLARPKTSSTSWNYECQTIQHDMAEPIKIQTTTQIALMHTFRNKYAHRPNCIESLFRLLERSCEPGFSTDRR